jgi:hypothetical protein
MTAYLWVNLLSSFIFGAILVIPLAADKDKNPFPILVPPRSITRFELTFKLVLYIAYGTWTAYLLMP